jgi:hypothetical protein
VLVCPLDVTTQLGQGLIVLAAGLVELVLGVVPQLLDQLVLATAAQRHLPADRARLPWPATEPRDRVDMMRSLAEVPLTRARLRLGQ